MSENDPGQGAPPAPPVEQAPSPPAQQQSPLTIPERIGIAIPREIKESRRTPEN